jgi:hypothetical protein
MLLCAQAGALQFNVFQLQRWQTQHEPLVSRLYCNLERDFYFEQHQEFMTCGNKQKLHTRVMAARQAVKQYFLRP